MTETLPDLIIINGTVESPGARASGATAVAITGNTISAIGDDKLSDSAGRSTRIVDARGGAILPGINDGHMHFCASAVAALVMLDIGPRTAPTWEAVGARIATARPGSDGWIRAHGWDTSVLGPGGPAEVYSARPDTPVVAFDQTGHQLLLNAAAVRAIGGIPSVAPRGGVIGMNSDGSPNGLLIDGAMDIATGALPDYAIADLERVFDDYQQRLRAWGITSLTEPGLGPGGRGLGGGACATTSLIALGRLAESSRLDVRVNVLALFDGTGGASAESVRENLVAGQHQILGQFALDPEFLRISGVKVFADGTPRSGTAWMFDAYDGGCGHGHGGLVVRGATDQARSEELREIIRVIHESGLQAGVHATGDAATTEAVGAMISAQERTPRDSRHYVIHGAFKDVGDLSVLARHGIGYSTNPSIRAGGGAMVKRILGERRFEAQQPLASARRAGVMVNIASDSPVTSADWRASVSAACTRATSAGPARADDPERLSVRDAIDLMTTGPAWQDHAERRKGTIAPGFLADLCVLSEPLSDHPEDLIANSTALTVVDGRVVYESH